MHQGRPLSSPPGLWLDLLERDSLFLLSVFLTARRYSCLHLNSLPENGANTQENKTESKNVEKLQSKTSCTPGLSNFSGH